jgi:type IV pilus assembly protein PilY1
MSTILPARCRAANQTYASLPPFISSDTKANVVFVTDFSGSMGWQAYYGNYSSATEYYGYFDSDAYYTYNNTNNYWEVDSGTSYANLEAGDVNSLSGNFLNFLVTTRVDAVLKSLIGGKADCPSGQDYCLLRPQGSYREVYDSNLNAKFTVWSSSGDIHIRVENWGTSTIGTFWDRHARVKIDADDRRGLIQDNFAKLRFTFIAYAYDSNSAAREGLIKYGFHEDDLDTLISRIQNTTPSGNTHTGEALREAYYYLTQNAARQSYNSNYIADGTEVDPYYEKRDDGTLEPSWCRKSFVVLISDGEWNGSIDPDAWAHKLHTDDLRQTDTNPNKDLFPEDQTADVYSIFAFSSSVSGEQSMKTIAAFGNYDDLDSDGIPYDLNESSNSKYNGFPRSNCNPSGTYDDACEEWDSKDNNGSPDAFYYASNGQAVSSALTAIFESIRQGTASGSAVTALTSRVSTGNVVAQAAFFPEKEFDDGKEVTWIGDVFGEWYLNGYIPNASSVDTLVQNIREDTNNDYSLQVKDDRIIEYVINNKDLTINAYDSNEYGTKLDTTVDKVYDSIEEINNLFDCGEQLRTREPDDRTIYGVDENDELTEFTVDNKDEFDTLLGDSATEYPDCLLTSGAPDYEKLIKYTRGEPVTSCRSRATNNSATDENVWKIGDIIYSSPTIVEYDDYALVYTGSNNGMLHAFHMGFIKNIGQTLNPAKLCDDSSASTCTHTSIGKEAWAFVPKDAMPYLRYMASPDYDHIYAVDLKPYIVNMGSRVILIGGMRFGGGTDATDADAINPPSDTGTVGRSAYYALDITKPLNPKYLWRYAPDGMGFSYSGPAYVKRKDSDGSWHYFVMFASGPTTYEGRSTQDLQIFTVDLFTGEEKDVFGDKSNELGINNAFGGRLFTNGIDINEDGQTDFIFLGFTENADGAYSKMKGGIIKIWTGSDDPLDWDYDKTFLGFNANPITAPIKVMDCFPDQLSFPFLYFGTGRYFVSNDETQDTNGDVNYLYGVPFNYGADNTPIKGASSINSSNNASALTCETLDKINTNPLQAAWHIPLEEAGGNYLRERCYSDPSITEYNIVFFDTARPTDVVCECGGQARSWVVNCASGMAIDDVICAGTDKYVVDEKIQFTYLIQRSGGDIQQYGEDEFTENDKRTTAWGEGVPSEQGGLPTFPSGSMLGTILYWKQW